MRPSSVTAAVLIATVLVASCSSDSSTSTVGKADAPVFSYETALPPGTCDPTDDLATPSITTSGSTTLATLGIGDFGCSGLNGNGYISFNYNPVLIDGQDTIEVGVGDGVAAIITWAGEQPFTEKRPGIWASSLQADTCSRLTIDITNTAGTSTGTFGADIRVGGKLVPCPQRKLDPSDPSDGDPDATSPLPETTYTPPATQATKPATTKPATTKPATTTTSTPTTRSTAVKPVPTTATTSNTTTSNTTTTSNPTTIATPTATSGATSGTSE